MTARLSINFLNDNRFNVRNALNRFRERFPNNSAYFNECIAVTTAIACTAVVLTAYISSPLLTAAAIGFALSSNQFL